LARKIAGRKRPPEADNSKLSRLSLAEPRAFASWLRVLFRHDWVVYAKRPFGGPEHALRYLGAYTHRVAISNSRLVALSEGNLTFRWRESAHRNKKRLMTLPVEEFLRRFLLHLLPRGLCASATSDFLLTGGEQNSFHSVLGPAIPSASSAHRLAGAAHGITTSETHANTIPGMLCSGAFLLRRSTHDRRKRPLLKSRRPRSSG